MSRLGLLRPDSLEGRKHKSRSKGSGLRSLSNITDADEKESSIVEGKDGNGETKTNVVHFDDLK
jgi:hypothetical protein